MGDTPSRSWCQYAPWFAVGPRGEAGRREVLDVHPDQTVSEMVEEVLERQAGMLADETGQSSERAMSAASKTDAARRLKELAEGPYGEWKAAEWQADLPRARAEERHYWWLEGHMEWPEGKKARTHYHALLEELASLRG